MTEIPHEPSTTTPRAHAVAVTVIGLGLTQVIGWGTSFSALAILGTPIARDLDLPREAVFAGMTIMLIVSGLISPAVGRRVDRDGPLRLMMIGSALSAAALLLMSVATGPLIYGLAWSVFGVAVPMALGTTAVSACVQVAGPQSRRAVTGLIIIAGLTSFFFLPLTAWLEARHGWRGTLQWFALGHLLLALPIHYAVLPRGRPEQHPDQNSTDAPWDGLLPVRLQKRAFLLIVAWSCLEGMLVWGFNLQAVDLLQGLGLPLASAVAVWMFSAPSQALSRVADFMLAGRYSVMATGLVAAAMAPIGFAILYLGGFGFVPAALMAIFYGVGHGLFAIARNILPLRLFGMQTYGATMGRLSMPQNIANGLAPILFAALLARMGSEAALLFAAACALVSLVCVALLARTVAEGERDPRVTPPA